MLIAQNPAETPSPTAPGTGTTSSGSHAADIPLSAVPPASVVRFSPGTLIRVKLEKRIDTKKARVGDQVIAKTIDDLKSDSTKLAPEGCKVFGHIVETMPHQGNSPSTLKIVFDKLVMKNGTDVPLPATIQAVEEFQASYGGTSTMSGAIAAPTMGGATAAASQIVIGSVVSGTVQKDDPKVSLNAEGAINMSGVTLRQGPALDSVLSAPKKNVVLEDGDQMLLRVMYSPAGEVSTPAQTYLNPGQYSNFAQVNFGVNYLGTEKSLASNRAGRDQEGQRLIEAGIVSALDLKAPGNAIDEFNRATVLLEAQRSKEAIPGLRKAISIYPDFVAAHMSLGKAYLDQDDAKSAKSEFEAATKLDSMFAGSFLNLGRLALSESDFVNAQSNFEAAASIRPKDAIILSNLAYAQHKNHHYREALATTQRVHELDHKGMANVHSIGFSAAKALNDSEAMERELNLLLSEDPTGPLAPAARRNLEVLAYNKEANLQAANTGDAQQTTVVSDSQPLQSFPNADRLKSELRSLDDEDQPDCVDCNEPGSGAVETASASPRSDAAPGPSMGVTDSDSGGWVIRKRVEQVALFFNASQHGHLVSDLKASDVQVLDNNLPPEKVVAFSPQSKLPVRLALLVDASGSVHDQFGFEKRAATRFMQNVLRSPSDIAFVAGFSSKATITQDFTAAQPQLAEGIQKLANGGGTALFDAASLACWKLADYPDDDRVARVIVILSDGEDNSSSTTLKQVIQIAEKTNVTIYTISTKEDHTEKTDADKVLQALAERSGGEAINLPTLGSSFDKVNDLIRSRYFIAYKPANLQPDGSYRTIRISAHKNGEQLQIRARKGYHARLEANAN